MGRQSGDSSSTRVNSSIALLQERFKELQRVKEKRQEKELLKLFSDSSTERHTASPSSSPPSSSSSKHFEPSSLSSNFQPPYDHDHISIFRSTPPSSPSPSRGGSISRYQDPSSLLSLGLPSYDHDHHHQPLIRGPSRAKSSQITSLWSSRVSSPSSSSRTSFGHSDVDTSLRL
ncbi:hypothetical protein LINGRAHAP2_LOCUS35733 [Linum grandiflorum]